MSSDYVKCEIRVMLLLIQLEYKLTDMHFIQHPFDSMCKIINNKINYCHIYYKSITNDRTISWNIKLISQLIYIYCQNLCVIAGAYDPTPKYNKQAQKQETHVLMQYVLIDIISIIFILSPMLKLKNSFIIKSLIIHIIKLLYNDTLYKNNFHIFIKIYNLNLFQL